MAERLESSDAWQLSEANCRVALTKDLLKVEDVLNQVRDVGAGAIVMFAGTTRDNFEGKPVRELRYSAYNALALRTMLAISRSVAEKHALKAISMVHRLGTVPIGEESIIIAVSAPHRESAWRASEEALEECKAKVEIWKLEQFEDEAVGVWRANRDTLPKSDMSSDGTKS